MMVRAILLLVFGFFSGIGAQNNTCGKQFIPSHTSPTRVPRVVGGGESIPHSWPWMVLLRFRTQDITCGGALVRGSDGKVVVITAAHCIDGHSFNTIDWKVDVGLHSRSAQESNQKEYSLKEIIVHPRFNVQYLEDDIAILKPTPDIEENDYVQPICLTTTDSNTMLSWHSFNTIDWKVDVGLHSRSAQESNQKEYSLKEIIVHPRFNVQYLEDDIAILKPTPDIEENDYVQPICLTTTDSNTMVGKQCVVAGWGSDKQGGQPVDRLHEVYKSIISDAECTTALGLFGYNETAMLCAGDLVQGGVDACSWNSGVPYACRRSDGHWEMVGVSSWGYGCAQPGYPGVYTEVFHFTQWILDNTGTSSPTVT